MSNTYKEDEEELKAIIQQVIAKRSPPQIVTKAQPPRVIKRIIEKQPQTIVIKADKVVLQVDSIEFTPNMTINPEIHIALPSTKTRKVIERTPDGKLSAIVEEAVE